MMRKGVAYTIVAVLALFVIGTIFFTQQRVGQSDLQSAAADRVRAVNSFIKDLDKDSQRAAYIAGFRTFIAMEQEIVSTGDYFTDVNAAFKEIFLTGNLSGTDYNVMLNSSFDLYVKNVQQTARKQGIQFNATVTNVSIWQVDPWEVLVNYTMVINASDLRGTARWDLTRTFTGRIFIEDLRDPIYSSETLGRVQRVIKRTNISEFVNDVGNMNDTSGLYTHFNESFYTATGRGPSVLMRFAGNFSDSPYGIESLVDVDELDDQGIIVHPSFSVVDYLYFTGEEATYCNIQNLPIEIKFDDDSAQNVYEVDGELTYSPC